MASAGPYANLRLAPDRITMPASHHSVFTNGFLQAGCPSCHPTNSVKALKAFIPNSLSRIKSSVTYSDPAPTSSVQMRIAYLDAVRCIFNSSQVALFVVEEEEVRPLKAPYVPDAVAYSA